MSQNVERYNINGRQLYHRCKKNDIFYFGEKYQVKRLVFLNVNNKIFDQIT